MTLAGGSAMMYGVLYQLLGAAHWAAKADLATKTEGELWTEASLVIEPQDGGDLQVTLGQRRVVEQWKARSDSGAWSLRSVIEDVLPDLYRAVESEPFLKQTEYRFVTEGHRGRWLKAKTFFESLSKQTVPSNPLTALDPGEKTEFLPRTPQNRIEFFRYILDTLRTHSDIAADPELVSSRKLWHLLSNFQMVEERSYDQLVEEVDALLAPAVAYREDVQQKRRQLCAALLERAATGNSTFSPKDLFASVNLKTTALANRSNSREALFTAVKLHTQERWLYREYFDVRRPPESDQSSVLVFSGASGQGKTWRLASLAFAAFSQGSLAVALNKAENADATLLRASRSIARPVLGIDSPIDLDLLVERMRALDGAIRDEPWLTICVDDITSMQLARALVEQEWSRRGMRLAFSTVESIGRALRSEFPQSVRVIEVGDFGTSELREYLERHGKAWELLPADIRELLRRPLLAHLYCEIAADNDWQPQSEYSLFARFWSRVRYSRDQADHFGDQSALRKLAATFLRVDVPYPWTQEIAAECGLDADCCRRLETVGWVRCLDDDRLEIAHDRLLNWAVAESLLAMRLANKITATELADFVAPFYNPLTAMRNGRMLGYVPMDLCSLLLTATPPMTEDVGVLIAALDSTGPLAGSETLYTNLVPTLGPSVIPALLHNLRSMLPNIDKRSFLPSNTAKALATIAILNPNDVRSHAVALLNDESALLQSVGISVIAKCPSPDLLDRLWDLHKDSYSVFDAKQGKVWWTAYQSTLAALRACIQLHPEWIENRLSDPRSHTEPVSELAYLIANVPGARGRELWLRTKASLFDRVATNKRRALVSCIQQFTDSDEIGRLEEWLLSDGELVSELAFSALVRLAPDKALDALGHLDVQKLYLIRNWWLVGLLLRRERETHQRLLSRLIAQADSEKWMLAEIYHDDPNLMDVPTVQFLLEHLAKSLREELSIPTQKAQHRLYQPMGLLSKISKPEQLAEFESHRGKPLERDLTTVVQGWAGRALGSKDHESDNASKILANIGGVGITAVANTFLCSQNKHTLLDGIGLCLRNPNQETRQHLRRIACELDDTWDGHFPLVQVKAMVALAELGENGAVVKAVLRWGIVEHELAEVRRSLPPMSELDIAPAMCLLLNPDEQLRINGVLAIGISGRRDLAGHVRALLHDSTSGSKLELEAMTALRELRDQTDEALSLLSARLTTVNAHAAALAIYSSNHPKALQILTDELLRRGYQSGVVVNDILVGTLANHQRSRVVVANVIWKACSKGKFLDSPAGIGCLSELDEGEVVDFLTHEAFSTNHAIRVKGRICAAISALSHFDRDLAFRAAEIAMHRDGLSERHELAALLLKIDEQRAVERLLRIYMTHASPVMRAAIGRSLRLAVDRIAFEHALGQLLNSELPTERERAAELAGWQTSQYDTGSLYNVALSDLDHSVRRAAENSIGQIRRHSLAFEQMEQLESAEGPRCWKYLDTILILADSILLATSNDELGIGRRLLNKPHSIRSYTRERLQRKIDNLSLRGDDDFEGIVIDIDE